MFFEQLYLESLGHASYIVGDEATGEALVLDPRRDVGDYFDAARSAELRIAYALDSHGHNDYVSGLSEIAARQDVEVLGYAGAGLGYDHRPVTDGEMIELGDLAFEVVHTPGHTPEHVSLLVFDRGAGDDPVMFLSGGALLVGDVARPDLTGGADETRKAAVTFCHTIKEKILSRLADHVEVFPTHVKGSLCGASIGSSLSTTMGQERATNPVLARVASSDELVEDCMNLENLPAVPPYWRRMRRQNLAGPSLLGVLPEPPPLRPAVFEARREEGALVVDTRSPHAFAAGHIPGSVNVGLGGAFPTWAGTVIPERARTLLVLGSPADLWVATWELLRIGYDAPVGWLAGGMSAWSASGGVTETLAEIEVTELSGRLGRGETTVIDVRQPAEWAAGHIPGARFVTGADLPSRMEDIPRGAPVAVVCGGGYRASVAASLLRASGRTEIATVAGGMNAWSAAGLPTE